MLRELLKTFLGSPKKSSLQYRRWNLNIRAYISFMPTVLSQIRPERSSVWLMCYFSFYTLLSDWWESSDIPLLETNQIGDNLLSLAASRGHRPICEVLIKRGMDINVQGGHFGSPLAAAATSRENIEVVHYLIEQGADVNLPLQVGRFDSALCAAVFTGNFEIVKILIKKGADISSVLCSKVDEYFGPFGEKARRFKDRAAC